MISSATKFALITSLFAAAACGRVDLGKHEHDPSQNQLSPALANDPAVLEAKKNKYESQSGTLNLIPDIKGLAGMVTYTIYENGLLVYKGYVTYLPYTNYPYYSKTESFEGRYKADPKTFLSETYSEMDKTHNDFKLQMKVNEVKDNLQVVDVNVRERGDVSGRFEVDTSKKLIDIHYAEVTGQLFGEDVTIRVRK